MSIDPRMRDILTAFEALGPLPLESLSPAIARELPSITAAVTTRGRSLLSRGRDPGAEVFHTEHRLMITPEVELISRIYHPKIKGERRSGGRGRGQEARRRLPVVVYFHAGGFVIGSLDMGDASCRALANQASSIVVSVAYRKAPEFKYPCATHDAYCAYQWVLQNAPSFGGDPFRVSVAGESSGGNLAAVLCLMARDRGIQPPVHQLLIYPITNYAFNSSSYQEFANSPPLTRAMMFWFWGHYLENAGQGAEPYASPLRASDLSNLPPATLILAEHDPLRTEGIDYGERLRAAGVPAEIRVYPGVTHLFFGMTAALDQARLATRFAADRLIAALPRRATVHPPPTADLVTRTETGEHPHP